MSTKSTIFLTNDNEHCYVELCYSSYNEGDPIVIEFSKKNAEIILNDSEDIVLELKPGTEIYNIINSLRK